MINKTLILAISTLSFALLGNFSTASEKDTLKQTDIERFGKAMAQVRTYYVEDIKHEDILENALDGMLNGLDPHSDYLDADEYQQLMDNTRGKFAGLGIELTSEHGLIKVVTPIDDTPASKAGIKPADYISEVNGKSVHMMPLGEAVNLMRGEKNTSVTLTVLRKGDDTPRTFKIIRDIIKVKSVKSKLLDEHYGYIRISQFQNPTTKRLHEALNHLKKQSKTPLKGLVLDLRNNPGGLLSSAISVSDTFLNSDTLKKYGKKIVYTRGRSSITRMEAIASKGDLLQGAPMIVLVNAGSASAAEIVAGALQDYKRAIILGEPSFGKGSVQTILPLDKKHAIKLTTALYYTPAGRVIQAKGITPDIRVNNLQFEKSTSDALSFRPITEAKLNGHLSTKEEPKRDVVDKHIAKNSANTALITEDFQLHEALNLLKAMHLTKGSQ